MKNVITLTTLFFTLALTFAKASDFGTLVNLNGQWKFSIGDNKSWAQSDCNDSDWDQIYAPRNWEDQGYIGYDGYAWYRTQVVIPESKYNQSLLLDLGKIDDVNEVYFNGVLIGQMGVFPPNFETAYNVPVKYWIPTHLINFNGKNTLAIRVFDQEGPGGIVDGKLGIGYDKNQQLLALDLAGTWKLSFKNYKGCRDINYNDSKWDAVHVPASWESQGFTNYDGYAWYRKSFTLPANFNSEKLMLVMGKIDDIDKVYLNGELIGTYKDMYNTPLGKNYMGNWQIRRAYKIPEHVLNTNGLNTIAVVVYDEGGIGGIHEGPVGLMTLENYKIYEEANKPEEYFHSSFSLIQYILNEIFY